MAARERTLDFTFVDDFGEDGADNRPQTEDGKLLTPKQIRARMRRRQERRESLVLSDVEMAHLYQKPIEEWDMEELARGRPRNRQGKFSGPKPAYVTMAMHEQAMTLYTAAVKADMRGTTVTALEVIRDLIASNDTDANGKPLVSASTKLDASKFLLEHVIGKPTQRVENDVSVKLQGILGQVMVNPSELATGSYLPGHFPGITMEMSEKTGSDDDVDLIPRSE
jgi:hypothetical protein